MKINTQGVVMSIIMLAANIWGADTIAPYLAILAGFLGSAYVAMMSYLGKAHDVPMHTMTRGADAPKPQWWKALL